MTTYFHPATTRPRTTARPVETRLPADAGTLRSDVEPLRLTTEEIRRIVLDIIG